MKTFLPPIASAVIFIVLIAPHALGQSLDLVIVPGSTVTSFSADGSTSDVIDVSGEISVLFGPFAIPGFVVTDVNLTAADDTTFIEDFLAQQSFSNLNLDGITFIAQLLDEGAADDLQIVFGFPGLGAPATITGGFDLTASGEGGLIFDVAAVAVPEPGGTRLMAGILAALCVHRRLRHPA